MKKRLKKLIKHINNRFKNIKTKSNYPEFNSLLIDPRSDDEHLTATMDWLCYAQDITNCDGVSAYFDLAEKKWDQPYRETTGYIIETFLNYFLLTGQEKFLKRAISMGEWELSQQCEDGSFGEVKIKKNITSIKKKIFNTGQIIIGLISLYKQTNEKKYLESAIEAGNWIVTNQEIDGSWQKFITLKTPKTYYSRVSWPLLMLYKITKEEKYYKAAQKNINWVLKQQQENFWFDNTSLTYRNEPWTHLIGYTLSGLLEYYCLLDEPDQKIFKSFYSAANEILEYYQKNNNNFLPCTFDKNWQSRDKSSCLTGDAQIAIVWMQIYQLTNERKFIDSALKIIEQIKSTQILNSAKKEISGGVLGCYPLNGNYSPFSVINWGAKFFADSLILKKKIKI